MRARKAGRAFRSPARRLADRIADQLAGGAGMMRTYLDWNATAPLRPEARAAMIEATGITGGPSSVHAGGGRRNPRWSAPAEDRHRAWGRGGGCDLYLGGDGIGGADPGGRDLACAAVEHAAVTAWCRDDLAVDATGKVSVPEPGRATLQLANAETGVLQDLPQGLAASDLTQAFGKVPFAFNWLGIQAGFVSAHKLGGPRGIGALIVRRGTEIPSPDQGRRTGTGPPRRDRKT